MKPLSFQNDSAEIIPILSLMVSWERLLKNIKDKMDGLYIGFDTSCYTTSVACVNSEGIILDERIMLSVPKGERGLRQSDALFQHTRNMPKLLDKLFESVKPEQISGVGVSQKPVFREDSYMPVFLCGVLTATAVASSTGHIPLSLNHQLGHIRAALHDGNEDFLKLDTFICFHISGGTTDLLKVSNKNGNICSIETIGSSTDLHAGQFVDRIGVKLGLSFPSGKHLEMLAGSANDKAIKIPSSVQGLCCSFSGAETYLDRYLKINNECEIAYSVYDCLARTFIKLIHNANETSGISDFLICGGVSSSKLLRTLLNKKIDKNIDLRFGRPELSSDNAVGIALATRDLVCKM